MSVLNYNSSLPDSGVAVPTFLLNIFSFYELQALKVTIRQTSDFKPVTELFSGEKYSNPIIADWFI